MRFFLGPLLIVAGVLMMKYTVQITNYTGKIDFAEKYLGGGTAAGTYTWWRLLGLAFCILAVLWMMGILSFQPKAGVTPSNPLEPSSHLNISLV
jgi:hypothetical protein